MVKNIVNSFAESHRLNNTAHNKFLLITIVYGHNTNFHYSLLLLEVDRIS